ncbi:ABC transporter substrate-binding protein [Rhodobacteraceae bacterium NNCM2]|nr:ABC transporter substrate-binding protein [Coraliihabitans acroporae]
MNLCTDQLAMLVAEDGQLVSISYLAQDPRSSAMAAEATAFTVNHGLAEEIFLLDPDLVIAGTYSTRTTVSLLRKLGIKVVEFEPASSLDDIRARIRQMGDALDRKDEAAQISAQFDADLAVEQFGEDARPRAATYYANNYTSGNGTLADSILEAAGLANIADELGLEGGSRLPLERLVMAAPALIVSGQNYDTPAMAQEVLQHPALKALRSEAGSAPIADSDWVCGTPMVMAAIRRLRSARDRVLKEH